MSKKILAVDDEPNNLKMLNLMLREHYQLIFASNGADAIDAAIAHKPDLILLDIMMPVMNGYEVCVQLMERQATRDIPVIFVTAMSEIEDESRGFDVGAVDYIQKPLSAPILLRRIEAHLSLVKMRQLEQSYEEAVHMLGEAGHYNDTDTGVHIWRMAAYACALATEAGWSASEVNALRLAASMHDMGKIGVPDEILKAPRALTAEEWTLMRKHCEIGSSILKKSNHRVFAMAAEIAHSHHEKWDGSGYPDGLVGDAIPESARIVALADVFDALTMKRPYKEPWGIEVSMAEIQKRTGSHFEPRLAAMFEKILPQLLQIKDKWNQESPD